jgi:hypothetical protein
LGDGARQRKVGGAGLSLETPAGQLVKRQRDEQDWHDQQQVHGQQLKSQITAKVGQKSQGTTRYKHIMNLRVRVGPY